LHAGTYQGYRIRQVHQDRPAHHGIKTRLTRIKHVVKCIDVTPDHCHVVIAGLGNPTLSARHRFRRLLDAKHRTLCPDEAGDQHRDVTSAGSKVKHPHP
jgi:hypothetical protein